MRDILRTIEKIGWSIAIGVPLGLSALYFACKPGEIPAKEKKNLVSRVTYENERKHFPSLDVDVSFKDNEEFIFERVRDVPEGLEKLSESLGFEYNEEKAKDTIGYCMKKKIGDSTKYMVLLDDDLDYDHKLQTRGHEIGHLLCRKGQADEIYNRFIDPERVKEWVGNEEEKFAYLCGWIALSEAGVNVKEHNKGNRPKKREQMNREAKDIFLEGYLR